LISETVHNCSPVQAKQWISGTVELTNYNHFFGPMMNN